MTYREFVRSLADEYELDFESTRAMVKMVFTHLGLCILRHSSVHIVNFGVFNTVIKKARAVANNLNILGEYTESVGPRLVLRFKPSSLMKRALREESELIQAELRRQ